jgi:hypothetical protein
MFRFDLTSAVFTARIYEEEIEINLVKGNKFKLVSLFMRTQVGVRVVVSCL